MGFLGSIAKIGSSLSGFGPVASIASSVIGGLSSSKAQADANAANIQIAKMNNDANRELAEQQNQWNIDQWNRENEYNSPKAQLQRNLAAGLNPNTPVDSSNAAHLESADLANQQAASPVQPVDMIGGILSRYQQDAQTALLRQQAKNVAQDTQKKEKETDILASDAKFRDAWNEGQLKTQNMQIDLGYSRKNLTDEQIQEVKAKVANLNAQTDVYFQNLKNLKKEFELLDEKTKIAAIEREFAPARFRAILRQMDASVRLSDAQIDLIKEQIKGAVISNKMMDLDYAFQVRTNPMRFKMVQTSEEQMTFMLDKLKEYADADKWFTYGSQVLGAIAQCIGAAAQMRRGGSPQQSGMYVQSPSYTPTSW